MGKQNWFRAHYPVPSEHTKGIGLDCAHAPIPPEQGDIEPVSAHAPVAVEQQGTILDSVHAPGSIRSQTDIFFRQVNNISLCACFRYKNIFSLFPPVSFFPRSKKTFPLVIF